MKSSNVLDSKNEATQIESALSKFSFFVPETTSSADEKLRTSLHAGSTNEIPNLYAEFKFSEQTKYVYEAMIEMGYIHYVFKCQTKESRKKIVDTSRQLCDLSVISASLEMLSKLNLCSIGDSVDKLKALEFDIDQFWTFFREEGRPSYLDWSKSLSQEDIKNLLWPVLKCHDLNEHSKKLGFFQLIQVMLFFGCRNYDSYNKMLDKMKLPPIPQMQAISPKEILRIAYTMISDENAKKSFCGLLTRDRVEKRNSEKILAFLSLVDVIMPYTSLNIMMVSPYSSPYSLSLRYKEGTNQIESYDIYEQNIIIRERLKTDYEDEQEVQTMWVGLLDDFNSQLEQLESGPFLPPPAQRDAPKRAER